MSILLLLIQFVFRVSFGVAVAMRMTPAKLVTSGFYRVHLWVLMGLNTLAALCLYSQQEELATSLDYGRGALVLAVLLAVACYVGAVLWLYERRSGGEWALVLVATGSLLAAILATPWRPDTSAVGLTLAVLDLASSGLLLGVTLSAMFLGHWYLNTPTMELLPLRRLVLSMALAVVARTVVSGTGLTLQALSPAPLDLAFWIFIGLRWLAGLLGALMMAVLTWQTLKIPNTQSATGILYAGVIVTFIGELTSQFLSVDAFYPL